VLRLVDCTTLDLFGTCSSHLAGTEDDPVLVEPGLTFPEVVLSLLQLFSSYTDRQRSQVVVYAKIVLVVCNGTNASLFMKDINCMVIHKIHNKQYL